MEKFIVLPTQDLIDEFISDTGLMAIMDYDQDEVLADAFTAISVIPEIEYRINGFFNLYSRWGEGKNTLGVPDGQILSNAFLKLVRGLLDIYKRVGMWDATGFCPYHYYKQEYRDCVLCLLD